MTRASLPLSLVVAAFCFVPWSAAQDAEIVPPHYVRIDDMILHEDALRTDSAYAYQAWPFGVVFYSFDANVTLANRLRAREAMNEISAACGVDFVARTNEPNWIEFRDANENSSMVGMMGGRQIVRMVDWSARFVIVHELFHALGYVHEHQRTDRGLYVTIDYGNVEGGQSNNFWTELLSATITPYDFMSVMHYRRDAFSRNGQDTIVCKPAYTSFQNAMGRLNFISLLDAQGLQARYGTSHVYPVVTSVSPATLLSGAVTQTILDVYGGGFTAGSFVADGVQGTRILWNGTALDTDFVDSGHLRAFVTPSMRQHPGVVQVAVRNPTPGTNSASAPVTLTINCDPTPLLVSGGGPVPISNGCQTFVISPAYNAFNVVATSSPSDWDLQMGSGAAAASGSACDFLVGSGFFGGGTVAPISGNLVSYAGTAPTTFEHAVSTSLGSGTPAIATLDAGSIVRAFHYRTNVVGMYTLQVAGPPELGWKLLWAGNSFEWRSSTTNVHAAGTVGLGPVNGIMLAPGDYCLVVFRNGGPSSTPAPLTVSLCFDLTPVSLTPGTGGHTAPAGSCAPFVLTPISNAWNVVGVGSSSDWDIQIGPAVSQAGGSTCDYLVADGNLGSISPLVGIASAFTYPGAAGFVQLGPSQYSVSMPASGALGITMLGVHEFFVPTSGNYGVSVNAAGYVWDLHRPNGTPAWRSAATRSAGPFSANGTTATLTNLDPGWHAIVVYRNGGPSSLVTATINVAPATPPPALAAISPSIAPAGSPNLLLSAFGSNFSAGSTIVWDGSPLGTTFVSSTELRATVHATRLALTGTFPVSVTTAGAGTSGTLAFVVGNPVPVLTGLSSTYAVAGSTPLTLLATGSGFAPGAEIRFAGQSLPTTRLGPTSLSTYLDSLRLSIPGTWAVDVVNPAPAGGVSASINYQTLAPVVTQITPASLPILGPGSPPFTLTVQGAFFHEWSLVYANARALPTTFVNPGTLSAQLDPGLFVQAGVPGALAIAIENSPSAVSNLKPLAFGGGLNAGLARTHPLAPGPGQPFSLRVEDGVPLAPVTLVVDAGGPIPIANWPTAAADQVLAVTAIAGSSGPWLALVDGLGVFGVPDGRTFGAPGLLELPGLVMPAPPAGVPVTLQAVYADPTALLGFRLTWPLYTFDL